MAAAIDALTSPTLKHLREAWWATYSRSFGANGAETGNRILMQGGEGLAEVAIGRSDLKDFVGVDLVFSKVLAAHHETASHNQRVQFAAADACCLHFAPRCSIRCIPAVAFQHVSDVDAAVAEMARVTTPRGHVVAVEPDNSARWIQLNTGGAACLRVGGSVLSVALSGQPPDSSASAIGPNLPRLFSRDTVSPLDVRLFLSRRRCSDSGWAEVTTRRRRSRAAFQALPMQLGGWAASISRR